MNSNFHKQNKYPGKIPNISADGLNGSLNKSLFRNYHFKLNKEKLAVMVGNESHDERFDLDLSVDHQ